MNCEAETWRLNGCRRRARYLCHQKYLCGACHGSRKPCDDVMCNRLNTPPVREDADASSQ